MQTVNNLEDKEAASAIKKFFWKDLTGRGFSNTLTLEDLLEIDDESDDDDESLHEWAEYAEQGDEWEDSTMQIICIEA